ncbi:MAG: toxin-antitoxin system HicB family antitoxin [Actinomycetes bacterium]
MSAFIDRLSGDLSALGKLGGPELESAVLRLLPTLEPVLRTRLLEAFAEVAAELKGQIPGSHIDARLNGDDLELVHTLEEHPAPEAPADLNARVTLRLPEDLKTRIEAAASNEGVSLNSWFLKVGERGSHQINIGGRQLKGKGRS